MPVSRSRGLSLLELMVVVAVVGIVTTLSVNSYLGFTQREKGATALKGIQAMANKARQLAMTRNQPVRLTIGTAIVSDITYATVHWEALPCADAWGTNCPTASCLVNRCGLGGCDCTTQDAGVGFSGEVGPSATGLLAQTGIITLPPALDGLCFEGGTGRPILRAAGNDCVSGNPGPLINSLPFALMGQGPTTYLVISDTGPLKLVDCDADAGDLPVMWTSPHTVA